MGSGLDVTAVRIFATDSWETNLGVVESTATADTTTTTVDPRESSTLT